MSDANGVLIEQAEASGELVYRGQNVMMGYAESADELSRGDDFGGVLATGDLAKLDVDGFYHIVDRLKRFIKIHGNRISLDEVERWIQQRGIAAYATGYDDKLIVSLAEACVSPTELAATITKEYKLHHSVVQVVACREVPLTSSGKVNYPKLLETVISSLEENLIVLDLAYLDWPIYQMSKHEKHELLIGRLKEMTQHHYDHCKEYASFLDAYGVDVNALTSLEAILFFPVRLFKSYALRSVPESEVFKVFTSSGTTSQTVS